MPTPIYDALLRQAGYGRAALHMPGHKGLAAALPAELAPLLRLDSTELPETGDLFAEEGAVHEAEVLAARAFGTARTLFSAGGSTLCIQAMLRAAMPRGGRLICGRVIHRAAADAFCLLDIEPYFLSHDQSAGAGFWGRITAAELSAALKECHDARAVYLTCPDYFGTLSDLKALANIAHAAGLPLLVDAAHGAHLDFLPQKMGAVSAGVDFAAQSAHKTLPALTGAAWLQLRHEESAAAARGAMRCFGSSSPSFPILLSLDCTREWLEKSGKTELADLALRCAEIKELLSELGFAQPLGLTDPLRIAFALHEAIDTGKLLRSCGIEPEFAQDGRVILIPGVANGAEDFARLSAALRALARLAGTASANATAAAHLPGRILSPRQAFMSASEEKPVGNCVGRTCAENIIPCPPAVPIVLAGELIDVEVAKELTRLGYKTIRTVQK
ncbi:MAG: aminotransferase class V-fold PLP-dependent enzyme [Clostridium sp.]|jgi:arginine/lysine/ornithine decarboxylase|nr:aminotransferase class V-fold PLP-dependent enzyme [Clostridium sp.]